MLPGTVPNFVAQLLHNYYTAIPQLVTRCCLVPQDIKSCESEAGEEWPESLGPFGWATWPPGGLADRLSQGGPEREIGRGVVACKCQN